MKGVPDTEKSMGEEGHKSRGWGIRNREWGQGTRKGHLVYDSIVKSQGKREEERKRKDAGENEIESESLSVSPDIIVCLFVWKV